MSELADKVKHSIERIQNFDPRMFSDSNSYYLAFSGGKDSCVCKRLMDMAGVKYDAHYRVTGVDPPELVRFIREQHPDVQVDIPLYDGDRGEEWNGRQITMWNLIPWKLMPPTRIVRYCCEFLKESGGDGRFVVTGVRWAESAKRRKNQGLVTVMGQGKKVKELEDNPYFRLTGNGGAVLISDNAESRHMVDACVTRRKTCLNPIIDWSDEDVWEFIRSENIPVCGLYEEGFKRLGCIGCPMASKHGREREFLRWPAYKRAYLRTFQKMLDERARRGRMDAIWRMDTAVDVFNWWMEYDLLPGQIDLLEEGYGVDDL